MCSFYNTHRHIFVINVDKKNIKGVTKMSETGKVTKSSMEKKQGNSLMKVSIHVEGQKALMDMEREDKSKIRSKCHTLHFLRLLKLNSKRADRMVAKQQTRVSYAAVGVVLVSDEDILVPDIPGHLDKKTGIPPEEIKLKKVKAGEEFFLTYYEYMFLMFRPEFAGFCSRGKDPFGVYFCPKMPKFLSEENKLPTPTINFSGAGSPKETMEAVDEFLEEDKKWVIKEKYRDKFGSLLPDIKPIRKKDSIKDTPTPVMATIGLANILSEKYGYSYEVVDED